MGYFEKVQGTLNRGFQGHIAYIFSLPESVKKMRVTVAFDKREPEQRDAAYFEAVRAAAAANGIDFASLSEEEQAHFYDAPKGEINFSIIFNGQYLGSAHRNMLEKEAVISPCEASKGFEKAVFHGGVLKVILHCLNIVNDGTPYTVTIEGGDTL